MATAFVSARRFSQAEFSAWIESESRYLPGRYELIDGHIVVTPPTRPQHGVLNIHIGALLSRYVNEHRLGKILNGGYDLPSGDTLEPDVSFLSAASLAGVVFNDDVKGFCRVVPELAVEVLSRSTAHLDRNQKRVIYASNGVAEYWMVDPKRRSLSVLHLGANGYEEPRIATSGPIVSRVLPGLVLTVEEIFSSLD